MPNIQFPDMATTSTVAVRPQCVMVFLSREDLDLLNLALQENRDFKVCGGVDMELVFARRDLYWA